MMNSLVATFVIMSTLALTACGGGGNSATPDVSTISPASTQSELRGQLASLHTTAITVTETPRSADSFVDSVGIDTHLFYENTPYATNYSGVRSYLANLHLRHLRDGLADNNWQPYYEHLNDLATIGIHDDLITAVNVPMSTVIGYPARLPRAIESIEGPNEYNNSGDAHWVADLRAFQQLLYTTVKKTPSLSSFPVVGPSFTSYESCMAIGSLASESNLGNMHAYFGQHNPGTPGWGAYFPPYGDYGSIAYNLGIVNHVYSPHAIMATETGWDDGATYGATSSSVSAAVKARYTMRVLLEFWNAGVARTYLYELLDEGGQNYGLLNGSLAPKPAYTALSNLLATLNDPGKITLAPLTYAISADASVHHTLLQKRDGSYRLLLWVETPATDPAVPTQTVTLSLPTKFSVVAQRTWQDNGTFTTTTLKQLSDNKLVLKVTDRVTELQLQK